MRWDEVLDLVHSRSGDERESGIWRAKKIYFAIRLNKNLRNGETEARDAAAWIFR